MTAALLDHLWQSSLFAGACALLTLFFRGHRAGVRFGLWFAASLKFLVPFAFLTALGAKLSALFPTLALQEAGPRLILIRAEHWSAPARLLAQPHAAELWPALAVLWLAGMAVLLGSRGRRWVRLNATLAGARDSALAAPVAVKLSDSSLEPGLIGIFRPVILFPAGLLGRLGLAEVDAILAHEAAHLKRRDNLTAALHMLVEALFWFHPLVWLIGARMMAERERACDEAVLAHGHARETYAGSILGVCRFCLASPLACAAGAGGANLKSRISRIMLAEEACALNHGQRMLLAGAMLASLALPIAAGLVSSPLVTAVQTRVAAAQASAVAALQDGMSAMVETITPAPPPPPRKALHGKVARVTPPPVIGPPAPVTVPVEAPVQPAPIMASVTVEPAPAPRPVTDALDPRGAGDPDAITCRLPQELPGTRLPGPKVCKLNRIWAQLAANHATISPDGREVEIPTEGDRRRALNAASCNILRAGGGATNSVTGLPLSFCY